MSYETQTVEWKSSWRDEYLKWICGFANADGGVLEVGKDDSGVVVGLADARRLLEDIPNKISMSMAIVAQVDLHDDDGLTWLSITVMPYPNPISYHGKYYIRMGATNRELTGNALTEFLLRKQGRTWDSVPLPGVKVSDLDSTAFREFRRMAVASGRLDADDLAVDDYALIDSLRLAEGNHLERAAVLLFHHDPERWVRGAYVKLGFFENEADLAFMDEVRGPLITMADRVLDILYAKYFRGMISYQGIQRVETYPIARAALREAVLNAILHKDYASGVPIQIKVLPDRLFVFNVGGLPTGWTLEYLLTHTVSEPRNPVLASVFFRSGQVEAWGRGIAKMESVSRSQSKPAPVFTVTASDVKVTLPFPTSGPSPATSQPGEAGTDSTVRDVRDDVLDVLDNVLENNNLVSKRSHALLVALAETPQASQEELARTVGVTARTVRRDLQRLKEAGLIRRVGSDRQGHWVLEDAPASGE